MDQPGITTEAKNRAKTPGKLGGKLAGLSLRRQVLTLAIWPFLEQILGFLVATVDLVLSTRMSDGDDRVEILDALGLGGYVVWLMMILQGAVGTGVMAFVSRATGARDQKMVTKGLAQGLIAGLVTGVFCGLLIRGGLGFLVGVYQLSEGAKSHAYSYLSILCWLCPILGVMFVLTNALRAIGDTKTPFLAMVIVNVVNVTLSYLFVFGPEPFGGMGVRGLAWGSVFGWSAGMVCLMLYLMRMRKAVRRLGTDGDTITLWLSVKQLRPEWATMRRILRIGAPQGMEMTGMWLIHSVTLSFVAGLALSGSVGAHFIAIRVESMSFLPGFAIGTAGATLVGQYLGAGNPHEAARAVRLCWKYAAMFMGLIGVAFLLFPGEMVRLILPETDEKAAEVIELATPLVFLCGVIQPVLATCLIMKITLRGAGATRVVMRWSFTTMILFRAIMVPLGVTYFGFGLFEIWVIMFCDVTVQAVIFVWVHFRGRWKDAVV